MRIIFLFSLSFLVIGCAPTYVLQQNTPSATVKVDHLGRHPSRTSFDIFSAPKCEKQYFIGELADIGINIGLKKSSIGKVEANKKVYMSGARIWRIESTNLEAWCSLMFGFTPKENAVYTMKMNGTNSGSCSVEVREEISKEVPKDLEVYKLNRICRGDDVYFEK
jgi:hypothetical protein